MSLETLERPAADPRASSRDHGELATFHRTLAELCRAEVPLPRALRMLAGDLERRPLRRAALQMAREVENGTPPAEAYARRPKAFPPLYAALVEAGIESGDLPAVLEEISRHAAERAAVRDRLRRSLAAPFTAFAFVATLAILLIAFAPPLRVPFGTFPDFGAAAEPAESSLLLALGSTLGLIAVFLLCFAWLRHPLDGAAEPQGLKFRLPGVGRLQLLAARSAFASTLALLLRRRQPLERALQLTAATAESQGVRERIEVMALAARHGASLPETLSSGQLVSPSLLWLIEAAVASDRAADALADVGRIYRQRLERAVDRMAVIATPLAHLLVGLLVLVFCLLYLFPIARIDDLAQVFGLRLWMG